jgi:hypothetical protein
MKYKMRAGFMACSGGPKAKRDAAREFEFQIITARKRCQATFCNRGAESRCARCWIDRYLLKVLTEPASDKQISDEDNHPAVDPGCDSVVAAFKEHVSIDREEHKRENDAAPA